MRFFREKSKTSVHENFEKKLKIEIKKQKQKIFIGKIFFFSGLVVDMRKCNLSLFQRLGKAISLSVERFVTVGETIGEEACLVRGLKDAPGHGHVTRQTVHAVHGVHGVHGVQDSQARKDMLEACRESRHAGKLVEKLAENLAVQVRIT